MSDALAIEAVRRQVRELVDGSLEIKLHVEPRFKAEFHRLFPNIDMPVALAPLSLQLSAESLRSEAAAAAEVAPPRGGELARLAGRLCNDVEFQEWLAGNFAREKVDSNAAAALVRAICGVSSRAQLDSNADAAQTFHETIRKPFNEWVNGKER